MGELEFLCNPEIEDCEIVVELDVWDLRGQRKYYFWYTIVLGANAFI